MKPVERVAKLINFDLQGFFQDFVSLVSSYQQDIVYYYTNGGDYPKTGMDLLESLVKKVPVVYQKVSQGRNMLTNYSDFKIIDYFEDCVTSLQMMDNYDRWLRSSLVKGKFKEGMEVEIILRQNQTFENLSTEVGYDDHEEGALDILMRNKIKERDYDLRGGTTLTFSSSVENEGMVLQSVVDNNTGQNLLGKDLCKKITFTGEDILCLRPQDTFYQACGILIGLLKNDNPEIPSQGLDKSLISNKNVVLNMMPTFIRQLYATIGSDDTISTFNIVSIDNEGDRVSIEVQLISQLGNEVKQTINGN